MSFSGMDVEVVESLASRLERDAALIDDVVAVVDSAAAALASLWFGESFDRFHSTWHTDQRGQALVASTDIHAAIKNLRVQAQQQRSTSEAMPDASRSLSAHSPGTSTWTPPSNPSPAKPREYLELAGGAYDHPPKVIHADGHTWTPLSLDDLKRLGISKSDLTDPKSGFSATIYRSDNGQLVVSYEGTDGLSNAADVAADGRGATAGYALATRGDVDMQSQEAVRLAVLVHDANPNVTFTGHSLGGRLASLASIATQRPATTFNAAGANGADVAYARTAGGHNTGFVQFLGDLVNIHPDENARITAYVGANDPVNNAQNLLGLPPAMGMVHHVNSSSLNPIDAHQIADLRRNVTDSN